MQNHSTPSETPTADEVFEALGNIQAEYTWEYETLVGYISSLNTRIAELTAKPAPTLFSQKEAADAIAYFTPLPDNDAAIMYTASKARHHANILRAYVAELEATAQHFMDANNCLQEMVKTPWTKGKLMQVIGTYWAFPAEGNPIEGLAEELLKQDWEQVKDALETAAFHQRGKDGTL